MGEAIMGYGALTAFLGIDVPKDSDPIIDHARFWANRWAEMTPAQLEAELLPMFEKMHRACEELKRTGRLSVLEG
ncbi:MAG TPA: hypothetical protein VGK56_12465 [Anaerolineales bacterium]